MSPPHAIDRRRRLLVRLVFYPCALAVIAAALLVRSGSTSGSDEPVAAPVEIWGGEVGRGGWMRARVQGGRLLSFSSSVAFACDRPPLGWTLGAAPAGVRVRQHGATVTAELDRTPIAPRDGSWSGSAVTTVRAEMGVTLRGSLHGSLVIDRPWPGWTGATPIVCAARPVPFELRPGVPAGGRL